MLKHGKPTSQQPAAPPRGVAASTPPRILLVDDNTGLPGLCSNLIRKSGYTVDAVPDGLTAWEALKSQNYDLLLTDKDIPEVSGVELLQKIRESELRVPVILTLGSVPEDLFKGRPWLRPEGTLSKPFTVNQLVSLVGSVLGSGASPGQKNRV